MPSMEGRGGGKVKSLLKRQKWGRSSGWMNPKENDRRRWNRKERILVTAWTRKERKRGVNAWKCWRSGAKKVRHRAWKSAVRWKWYGGWSGHTGWSLLPSVSLPLSPSLSSGGWHFPSFIWPVTEGGKNRGVEKKEGEGRMSSRRTSKCSPADLLEEPEGTQLAHAAATHLLLVETYEHLSKSLLLSAVHRRINTLGRWVS